MMDLLLKILKAAAPAPAGGVGPTTSAVHVPTSMGEDDDIIKAGFEEPEEENLNDIYEMQDLVDGMDWEIGQSDLDEDTALETAEGNLKKNPEHYRELWAKQNSTDDVLAKADDGLKLDLGSGQCREAGHIGYDLYPHDRGTVVHDLTLGVPAPDQSAQSVRLVNSLSYMDGINKEELLKEVSRVLRDGGLFQYEGPEQLQDLPEDLVQMSAEDNSHVADKTWHKQVFKRVVPDAATADDAYPRLSPEDYDPVSDIVDGNSLGYYYSDATQAARENRQYGYPSQGAAAEKEHDEGNINELEESILQFLEEEKLEKFNENHDDKGQFAAGGGGGSGGGSGKGGGGKGSGGEKGKGNAPKDPKHLNSGESIHSRGEVNGSHFAISEGKNPNGQQYFRSHVYDKDSNRFTGVRRNPNLLGTERRQTTGNWHETGAHSSLGEAKARISERLGQPKKIGKSDKRRIASVAVMHNGKLLMGKRRDNGKWTIPGGHANEGEDMMKAAQRELEEETGIQFKKLKSMTDLSDVSKDQDKSLQVQGFRADLPERMSTTMKDDPDGEVYRWKWVDVSKGLPKEIGENLHVPLSRNIVLSKILGGEVKEIGKSRISVRKLDKAKQLVYGVVLTPDEVDTQEDYMKADDIEKAAHFYMENSRTVGAGHEKPIKAAVVESYIAPVEFKLDGNYGPQLVKKGAWVLCVKILDKAEWSKVVDGEYQGFSVGGMGTRS